MTDSVNPDHYRRHPSGVECIQISEHLNFCLGNVIKYVWRAGLKSPNAIEDLKKASWYLTREIERLEHDRNQATNQRGVPEPSPRYLVAGQLAPADTRARTTYTSIRDAEGIDAVRGVDK